MKAATKAAAPAATLIDDLYLALVKHAGDKMPITKAIQQVTMDFPSATKAEVTAAGERMGYKVSTCAINYAVGRKGGDAVVKLLPKRVPASERVVVGKGKGKGRAKGQGDLPPVGSHIMFRWFGVDAKNAGMLGQTVGGVVTAINQRVIVVLPDCYKGKTGRYETWLYKDNVVAIN